MLKEKGEQCVDGFTAWEKPCMERSGVEGEIAESPS